MTSYVLERSLSELDYEALCLVSMLYPDVLADIRGPADITQMFIHRVGPCNLMLGACVGALDATA